MSRQFVVVGLGRLGISMVGTLDSLGHEVLAIDKREDVTQDHADDLPNVHLVAADATDEDAMRGLNVEGFDAAAVMMGENHVEAGILATATLKEVGVPRIVARATGGLHARVFEKVGADRVIQPERKIGEQLARTMASPVLLDYVDLGEDEALIEAQVPKAWLDKSLAEDRPHGLGPQSEGRTRVSAPRRHRTARRGRARGRRNQKGPGQLPTRTARRSVGGLTLCTR
jgi:trk system potassium uptake protein TrkA